MTKDREEYNAYMRVYMLSRYHTRREESKRILGGKCIECGDTQNLEIDHIDRAEKKIDVAKLWSISRNRYLEELHKCQLPCREHHQQKTSGEVSVKHGGGKTGKRNCQCDLCRPVKNAYMRQWKRNKRAASSTG